MLTAGVEVNDKGSSSFRVLLVIDKEDHISNEDSLFTQTDDSQKWKSKYFKMKISHQVRLIMALKDVVQL